MGLANGSRKEERWKHSHMHRSKRSQQIPQEVSPSHEDSWGCCFAHAQCSSFLLFARYPCAIIVDDLLVWGEGTVEHDANLRKVLQRAREVDLKLCPKKCKFRLDQVSYVGHQFTKGGLKPDEAKVTAIKEMPSPDSPEALRRFPGMINIIFTNSSAISVRRLRHYANCYGMTYTGIGRHPSSEPSKPWRQTSLSHQS